MDSKTTVQLLRSPIQRIFILTTGHFFGCSFLECYCCPTTVLTTLGLDLQKRLFVIQKRCSPLSSPAHDNFPQFWSAHEKVALLLLDVFQLTMINRFKQALFLVVSATGRKKYEIDALKFQLYASLHIQSFIDKVLLFALKWPARTWSNQLWLWRRNLVPLPLSPLVQDLQGTLVESLTLHAWLLWPCG